LSIKWHKVFLGDSKNTLKDAKSTAEKIINNWEIRVLAKNPLLLTALLFV
jgi:hypothetical protein